MNTNVMSARLTASIENGSRTRRRFISNEKAQAIATEALDATGWKSYAAAVRHLDSKRIAHD